MDLISLYESKIKGLVIRLDELARRVAFAEGELKSARGTLAEVDEALSRLEKRGVDLLGQSLLIDLRVECERKHVAAEASSAAEVKEYNTSSDLLDALRAALKALR